MNKSEDKTLIILERKNGWYGGYRTEKGKIVQAFNVSAASLFSSIKNYADMGYTIVYLDSSHEEEFMKDRITMEQFFGTKKERKMYDIS